ncbi:TRAP transporter substrate-binding protein [Fodinicurvata sediminis]|uniref:TRAP transporter substrate-binding protein n=1 Tax=Fodinicurvata sediminis TaxID=1121832 RepID=UPI0003B7651E|nr:TRAP transporter substrate-binding protein [Fodinicurvata sediminis]
MKVPFKTCAPVAAAAALAFGVSTSAAAQGPSELDVASTFPKNLTYLGEGGEKFADLLAEVTNGEITLNIHGDGDLVPALEVFNAVSQGSVQAGWDWIGYWGGTVPVAGLAGAMPFGPDPELFLGWMWEGGGLEILQKAYDEYNVQVLPCHLTAPESGGWFNQEINSPEDFEGLTMRISGLGGKVLNKLGASTQLIPASELYVALERGRIDATEFSLPIIDDSLGFAEIADYYYFPGWHQPASWNSFIINQDVWDQYTEEEQAQFWAACKANIVWSMGSAPEAQAEVLERFEAEHGVEVKRFPDEVLDALREASREVLEEEAENDPYFKEAYESLQAYMETAGRWQELQTLPKE